MEPSFAKLPARGSNSLARAFASAMSPFFVLVAWASTIHTSSRLCPSRAAVMAERLPLTSGLGVVTWWASEDIPQPTISP